MNERGPDADETAAEAVKASLQETGPGRPLTDRDRSFFEERFARDLGHVRLHTDDRAAVLNRALGARAFTYGRDVFLGAGEYRPETADGRRLLAHELTHVVQQENGAARIQRFSWVGRAGRWAGERVGRAGRWTGERVVRGGQWAGEQVVRGGRWAGERGMEFGRWAGGGVANLARGAVERVFDLEKARECVAVTRLSLHHLVQLDFSSLGELLGWDRPDQPGPAALHAVVDMLKHPCLRMFRAYSWLVGTERIEQFRSFLVGAWRVIQDPSLLLLPIREALSEKVQQIGEESRTRVTSMLSRAGARTREHVGEVMSRINTRVSDLLDSWWPMLLETGKEMIWPWAGAWQDVTEIFSNITDAGRSLWRLEFRDARGRLIDAWRRTNSLVGRFYGWFFIASVLVGGILGAIFGGGVGAIPGAAAGAKVAAAAGIGLLISEVSAEWANLRHAVSGLENEQSLEELDQRYDDIADSGLALGIMGAMAILGGVAARFARVVRSRLPRRVRRPGVRDGPEPAARDGPPRREAAPEPEGMPPRRVEGGTPEGRPPRREERVSPKARPPRREGEVWAPPAEGTRVKRSRSPTRWVKGIGKVRARRLREAGITNVEQLQRLTPDRLREILGRRAPVNKILQNAQEFQPPLLEVHRQNLRRRLHGKRRMEAHHLIPQELLKNEHFIKRLRELGLGRRRGTRESDPRRFLDRHLAEIPGVDHRTLHRTKVQGKTYNQHWREWVQKPKNRNFTEADLLKQLDEMMRMYNIPRATRGRPLYGRPKEADIERILARRARRAKRRGHKE